MTLLYYIKRRIRDLEDVANSARSIAELRKCSASLAQYIAVKYCKYDVEMLEVTTEEFARGYVEFLLRERADQQPSTIISYMALFRAMVRHAQKEGALPGTDFTDEAFKELKKSLQSEDDADTERTYSITPYPFDAHFHKLLDRFSNAETAAFPYERARRHALMYIFCMLFYGVEIEEMAELTAKKSKDGKWMVKVPRLGVEVPLTGAALWAVEQCNREPVGPGPLFKLQEIEIPELISVDIVAFFNSIGIGLYRSQSIFSDWLGKGVEYGLTPTMVSKLVQGWVAGTYPDEILDTFNLVAQRNANDYGLVLSRWYVLVSYSTRLRGPRMRGNVDNSYILESNPDARMWDPVDIDVVKRDGKIVKKRSSAVSRYLFVKCTKSQADKIDRLMPNASILRTPGNTTNYATVQEAEILRLQTILRDFRDEMQLVDLPEWSRDNQVSLSEGTPVKILSGPFEGFEGTVYRVRSPKDQTQYNSLTIRVNCTETLALVSKIELNLLDIHVAPIGRRKGAFKR